MKNILIIQNYNLNKGDSSVVYAMIDALKSNGIHITTTSFDPELATCEYGVEAHDCLISFRRARFAGSRLKMIWYLLLEILWIAYSGVWLLFKKANVTLWLPSGRRKTVQAYLDADLVVLTGGHHFTSFNKFPGNFSHFWAVRFAQQLGKKNMMYGQTIGPFFGPFGGLTRCLTNRVVRRSDIITLREADCAKYCKGDNVFITAEAVFSLPTQPELANGVAALEHAIGDGKRVIGMTIHHIYFKHFYSREEYIDKMRKIIDNIIDNYDCNVLLIPMESNKLSYNDRHLAQEIRTQLHQPERFFVIDEDYTAIVTAAIIARTDIFIGTKTHSVVYGLKGLVPTISISYQQKSTEFMKMFGVEENVITMKDLNLHDFNTIFDRVYKDRDQIREKQRASYATVREQSLRNRDFAISLLEKL